MNTQEQLELENKNLKQLCEELIISQKKMKDKLFDLAKYLRKTAKEIDWRRDDILPYPKG